LALSKWILHFVQDDNRLNRTYQLPKVSTSVPDWGKVAQLVGEMFPNKFSWAI
jgi:hypothetical protein